MSTSELSPRARRCRVKGSGTTRRTGNVVYYEVDPANPPPLTPEQETRLRRLAALPDSEIDTSDIPEVLELPQRMVDVSRIRLDAEVVRWILDQVGSARWQDKLNAMLRRAMEEERAAAGREHHP